MSFTGRFSLRDRLSAEVTLRMPREMVSLWWYHENGVALEIQGDGKAHRHVITDELKELEDIKDTEFTIMSPISYFGRKRNGKTHGISMRWCSIWTAWVCRSSVTRCIR